MSNKPLPQTAESQRRTWFFWFAAVWALFSLVWIGVLEFDFLTHPFIAPDLPNVPLFRMLVALLITPATLIIAWLAIRRAPNNVVGLLLIIWCATITAGSLRSDSPLRNLSYPLQATWPAVWLMPIYFPTGRPVPRRFAGLIDLLAACCFVSLALQNLLTPSFQPVGSLDETATAIPNVLYISGLSPLFPWVLRFGALSSVLIIILVIPSLIIRYRDADHRERLQMKWLGWFSVVWFIEVIIFQSAGLFANSYRGGTLGIIAIGSVYFYNDLFIPLAIGNAMLRHRLYGIDILIRRTLIYSILTVILALVYFAGVIVAQSLLRVLTGQTSDLAIVLSTLIIAALFSPLRQRIQDFIDRRFYRRKYDAERTLTRFSATLRSEVDLDKLTATLLDVVQETMQPASVSLWLRETPETRSDARSHS